jgi:DNA (cytosine-5)-methyltransferase 1
VRGEGSGGEGGSGEGQGAMTVGSLFSGIGGLDLGLERAGMRVIWQSEIDPYASAVLHKHWPEVPNLGDITRIDWAGIERPDLVCGGDPCQQNSVARAQPVRGPSLSDEFMRCVAELRPRFVLRENPPCRLDAPASWQRVKLCLEELGYGVLPFAVRACCLGADHRRERVFLLAEIPDADPIGSDGEEEHQVCPGGSPVDLRSWWDTEPQVARVDDGVPGWLDRNGCLGNAVVPQVAEWIGRRIMEAVAPSPARQLALEEKG